MWRVARACSRECVAPHRERGGGGDGLPSPPSVETATRGRDRVSPRVPGPLGVEDKRSHPKNRGSMTVGHGGLGPPAYPIHPHKSVGLGSRKGPWKGTPFRRPCGNHWMLFLPVTRAVVFLGDNPWGLPTVETPSSPVEFLLLGWGVLRWRWGTSCPLTCGITRPRARARGRPSSPTSREDHPCG